MIYFAMPIGGVAVVSSYLNLTFGAGIQPTDNASNHIIARNIQFFSLADQGNNGLKPFYTNISVYHSTIPQDVRLWYHFFTKHASSCGYYVHLF